MNLKNMAVSSGSSQNDRISKKLAANYIAVEERSIEQLLEFIQAYAAKLTYYNNDNLANGSWAGFFNQQDFNIHELVAYLKNPAEFKQYPQKLARYSQPHISLLLSFLQLLQHPQQQFKDLTQRHLDFYYQNVLRLQLKAPIADQVNVIFTLEDNVDFYQINKGTLLTAGQDSLGNDLFYSLDEDFLASQAQLARVNTLAVKKITSGEGIKKITGIVPLTVYDQEAGVLFSNSGFDTFGDVSIDKQDETTKTWPQYRVHMGLMLSSPILLLEAGERHINLTLTCLYADLDNAIATDVSPFDPDLLGKFTEYFTIEISGSDKWLTPNVSLTNAAQLSANDNGQIRGTLNFKLILPDTEVAVAAPSAELAPELSVNYPVIRLLLKPLQRNDEGDTSYQLLKNIWLEKVDIDVEVQALKNLILRNDNNVLDGKSPFQPFGAAPIAGNSFYFANNELCSKKLDELSVTIEWMDLPNDFEIHYQAYSDTSVFKEKYKKYPALIANGITNDSFSASLKLYDNHRWYEIGEGQQLFEEITTNPSSLSSIRNLTYAAIAEEDYAARAIDTGDGELLNWDRYFKLELNDPDFMHSLYPLVVSEIANSMLQQQETSVPTVYPAYTPQIKRFSVGYKTHTSINLQTIAQQSEQQVIQITPTGVTNISNVTIPNPNTPEVTTLYPLLPRYTEEAALFLGFSHLLPPQNLSLLFQMIPSSGNSTVAKPELNWSYLVNDSWQELDETNLLLDTTNGLLDSGILRFAMPEDATPSTQLFSGGYYWLKAVINENSVAIGKTLDIRTQAVSATFIDQENAPDHLSKPLAANTITDLANSDPSIKSVGQPYPSTNGRMAENISNFAIRVSERLRHKQRGLASWDYERLVLEHFPEIYKVKCIAKADQPGAYDPAKVVLIVIPNVANTDPEFALQPKAPLYLLEDIKNYLSSFLSPFVKLEVKNPIYQQLNYRIGVKFYKQFEQGSYVKQLNDELVQFLTPWAYGQQADIDFGNVLHSSSVIQFIEQRPYVEYVTSLSLTQYVPSSDGTGQLQPINSSSGLAQTLSPEAILVSSPTHSIDMLSRDSSGRIIATTGIGYFKIGESFYIA